MAATGIGNPNGAVMLFDGGAPKGVSGRAFKTVISGGTFCFASGATGVVDSGTSSFVQADLKFEPNASGAQFNGIALNDAASGAEVTILTHGVFLLQCNATVYGGEMVLCDGENAVASVGGNAESGGLGAYYAIGRALTAGASGGFAVIQIGL